MLKKKVTKRAVAAQDAIPVAQKKVVDEVTPQLIETPIPFYKKLLFFLQFRDAFWSVPLWFFAYYFTGVLLVWAFGYGTAFYDPAFVQPLMLSGCVVVGTNAIAHFIVYFNYRTLQRHNYGKVKVQEGIIKKLGYEDFLAIQPWQRIKLTIFIYCFYGLEGILVFIKLT